MTADFHDDFDDDEMIAALRRVAAEVDPVPDDVRDAAHAAIGTRDLDGELAALVADSAAEGAFEQVRGGTAGAPTRRLLTFAHGDVQVDVEVSDQREWVDLIGQFTGASTEDCMLEHANGGRRELEVDSLGRFMVTGVPRGAVRARFRSADGASMTTAWVTL